MMKREEQGNMPEIEAKIYYITCAINVLSNVPLRQFLASFEIVQREVGGEAACLDQVDWYE